MSRRPVATVLLLTACASLRVETRALHDVNDAQPVALHLHPLRALPPGLPALGCAEVRPAAEAPPWAPHAAGAVAVVTALPARRSTTRVARPPGARWLLAVPEWSSCVDADGWALVRLWPATRRVRLELAEHRVVLPWDAARTPDGGRRLRQRGYVDGRPARVLVPRPRATR